NQHGEPRAPARGDGGPGGGGSAERAAKPRASTGRAPRRNDGEGGIRTLGTFWVHTLSRRAPSAARAPLRESLPSQNTHRRASIVGDALARPVMVRLPAP